MDPDCVSDWDKMIQATDGSLVQNSIQPAKRNFVVRALRGLARQAIERWEEWRYGIYTEANIGIKELGVTDPGCHHYAAFSYIRFREIMKKINISPGKDVFADIGSGLGRVVVMAASYPFRKVIGVEICKEFDTIARANIEKARRRLVCKNIELFCGDAREFLIPKDLSVVFFWSPFDDKILSAVFERLHQSLQESPREMTIIFTCPPDHHDLGKMKHELHWLQELENTALSSHVTMVLFKYSPPRSGSAKNSTSESRLRA